MPARMWPRELPASVLENPLRSAEIKVFRQLQGGLPDGWVVFYSRPWLGLTPTGGERDGECDFVVAHPRQGILMLEVKGGAISYDPETEQWRSRDRNGITHRIKDPVYQARTAKYGLLDRLKQIPGFDTGRRVLIRHGVIFPDAKAPPGDLGADRPRRIFCCRPEFEGNLAGWIAERLTGEEGCYPPGENGISALERLLAKPFTLPVPLGHVIDDDDKVIRTLTPQQYWILDAIQGVSRAAVGGGAGTGKTILAMEDARRLASEGRRTLLTCHGAPLAEVMRGQLEGHENLEVATFHELCLRMAKAAGVEFTTRSNSEFFDGEAPELLMRAVELRPELRWDAIVVDEAQDMRAHWLIALDAALRPSPQARYHVFFDTNQRVYGDVAGVLSGFDLVPIRLNRNLRNTKSVHAAAALHYSGDPITPDGPEGVPIEWVDCQAEALPKKIAQIVQRLVQNESVAAADIAVLVPRAGSIDSLAPLGRCAGLAALKAGAQSSFLTLDTIRRFKGLERKVVVLAATPDLLDQRELSYVALSRARTHLIVVGDTGTLSHLRRVAAPDDPCSQQS